MQGIIYKYTSPSGKSYIGKTTNETRRKKDFNQDPIKYNYSGYKINKARQKYGKENFTYNILITVYANKDDISEILDYFERYYIKYYNTYKNGYNLTVGGGGVIGIKMSDEFKKHAFTYNLKMTNEQKQYLLQKYNKTEIIDLKYCVIQERIISLKNKETAISFASKYNMSKKTLYKIDKQLKDKEKLKLEKLKEKEKLKLDKLLNKEKLKLEKLKEKEKLKLDKLLNKEKLKLEKLLNKENIKLEKLKEKEKLILEKFKNKERIILEKLKEKERLKLEKLKEKQKKFNLIFIEKLDKKLISFIINNYEFKFNKETNYKLLFENNENFKLSFERFNKIFKVINTVK